MNISTEKTVILTKYDGLPIATNNNEEFIVTRESLKAVFLAWKYDKITAKNFFNHIEFLSWKDFNVFIDEEDKVSICEEIVKDLEDADLHLIDRDQIDAYLKFLDTPMGDYKKGEKLLYDNLRSGCYFTKEQKQRKLDRLKYLDPYKSYWLDKDFKIDGKSSGSTFAGAMTIPVCTIEHLQSLLLLWQDGRIDAMQLSNTMQIYLGITKTIYVDEMCGEKRSLSRIIVIDLAKLAKNLIDENDINVYLDFLKESKDNLEEILLKIVEYKTRFTEQILQKKLDQLKDEEPCKSFWKKFNYKYQNIREEKKPFWKFWQRRR